MANTRTPLKGCVRHVRQHTREQSSFVFAVRLNVRLRLGRVLINAQIAAGYALTLRLGHKSHHVGSITGTREKKGLRATELVAS